MSDNKSKNRNRRFDNEGIRLAPPPISRGSYHVLPSIRQEFIVEPQILVDEPSHDDNLLKESTEKDFQPKKKDVSKRWKRLRRGKNITFGLIMFLGSAVVILPYLLGIFHETFAFLPFKYVPSNFSAINNIIETFKVTVANGWTGEIVNTAWINAVPSLILIIGILSLAINMIKSVFSMVIAVKPVKYTSNSFVYLLSVLAIFIASLVGAEQIGIAKIDFLADFIYGYQSSELFSMMMFAFGYLLVALICTWLNSDKSGYLD